MDSLQFQDAFEPYYEGRSNGFATIDPKAVEKARKLRDRLDEARLAGRERTRDGSDEAA
jgi:hypothetical protein